MSSEISALHADINKHIKDLNEYKVKWDRSKNGDEIEYKIKFKKIVLKEKEKKTEKTKTKSKTTCTACQGGKK